MLMNIGFTEAQSQESFQCFIFHDIDLLPENDGNYYSCPENWRPRHMSFLVDLFQYNLKLKYDIPLAFVKNL
ncbi:hypothetical protein OUZ56_012327 [Daphnia magna]|uniref:Galactosyltransferase N-terminal domain-containing protein n=1 Tax=Daphnia magna TaxID=35525 RepID=A0ABQ9Z3Z4_9CRUS|nr:hypothetical protein OUZ56_012327 [Daphnia magna]